jgi:hypothetical protein
MCGSASKKTLKTGLCAIGQTGVGFAGNPSNLFGCFLPLCTYLKLQYRALNMYSLAC